MEVKPNLASKTVVKNPDGTTSYNYNRIGTTWHYNYADLDVATQEKIREATHTKPFVVNTRAVNAGSPTTPLASNNNKTSKSSNTASNANFSGMAYSGLYAASSDKEKHTNLNLVSSGSEKSDESP